MKVIISVLTLSLKEHNYLDSMKLSEVLRWTEYPCYSSIR